MRIETLHVDRFGRFHDFRPEPFCGGMTVLYGPNEAGKSTLLAFVRSILFGFASVRSGENRYEPWCGGGVQGSLELRTRDGALYRISRTAGPKGGPVQVFQDGRLVGSQDVLESLLGPVGPDVFRKVFAFSLWELQDLDTLQEGEVRQALYGAGSGGIRVASVEKALLEEAQKLYKGGGNAKARLNELLREIDKSEKRLAELRLLPEDYERAVGRVAELESRLAEMALQEEDHRTTRDQLQARIRALPLHHEILDLQARISELPAIQAFPSEGLSRLEAFEQRLAQLERELVDSRRILETLRQRLEDCPVDPRILAAAEPISRLHGSRERWEDRSHRLPALDERLRGAEESLRREMRSLGAGWDEQRVRLQDLSVGLREGLERGRSRLQQAEADLRQATGRLQQAEEAVQAGTERVAASQEALARVEAGDPRLAGLDAAALASAQEAARRFRDESEVVDRAREEDRDACAELPEGWAEVRRPGLDEIRGWGRQLQESQGKVRDSEQREKQAAEAEEEARQRVDRGQKAWEALPQPVLRTEDEARARREDLRQARQIQEHLREVDQGRQAAATRAQDLERTAGTVPASAPAVAALVAVALTGWLLWQQQVAPGLLCLVLGLALAWRLRQWTRDQAAVLEAARADLAQRGEALEKARQQASGRPAGQDLEKAETELAEDLEKRTRWLAARESLEQTRADRKTAQGKVEDARTQAAKARRAAQEASDGWEAWCRQRRLPSGSPETQVDFMSRLKTAQDARRRLEVAQERKGRAGKALDQAKARLAPPLAELGRTLPQAGPDLVDFLVRLAAEADQARRSAGSVQDLKVRHEQVLEALREAGDTRQKAGQARDAAGQTLEEARQAWTQWAACAGLDPGLSPETALDILARVGQLQRGLSDLEQMRLERRALDRELQDLLEQARDTALQVGMPPCDAAGWVTLVEALAAARDEALANLARRRELETNLQEAEEAPMRLELERNQVRQGLSELLQRGGATDGEDFRRRAGQWEHLDRLRGELRQRERSREALGVEPRDLMGVTPAELESQERELVHLLEDLEAQRSQVADERTRLTVEIEKMAGAEESSALAQGLETSRAGAREMARDWAVRTLARSLVGRARQAFERERQPFVLQRAAEHFKRMTAGHFVRVYHPLEEDSPLRVETSTGHSRQPEALSRGTAEQLYLALRLGFIEDFSRRRDPLPLVMDDIFVNFDGQRAHRALEVLGEMAEHHQVLVFTCHAGTVERARRVLPQVQVVHLQEEVRAG